MTDRTVRVRLEAITAQYSQKFRKAGTDARVAGREISESAIKSKESWTQVGLAVGTAGAAIAAGLGVAGKASIDFESSFAGVRKTVNASEAEFAAIASGMRDMARSIPTNVNDLNAIGEAAGQLGIETGNLLGFTRTMADLGETTNLSADEAATSLARLANITQMSQTDFDRLGSTIVALGNSFATTESEIVEMGQRIAGAGAQIGLTEPQIMAISAALSSLGINAEAGGTAISKVMIDIASQVANGGDKLAMFAEVAGMSAGQFATAWEDDASAALGAFVSGLGRMEEQGGSTLQVLEELGITEVRMRDALLRASGAGELWAEAGVLANEAWSDNVALTEEAEQRYQTTEARIQLMRNALNDAAITLGDTFSPAVGTGADVVAGLAGAVANLEGPTATAVTAVGGLAGAASLAAGGFLLAAPRIVETRRALSTLADDMPRTIGGLRKVGTALAGPWGAALAVGVIGIGAFAKAKADARRKVEEFKDTLDEETAALTENTRTTAINRLEKEGMIDAARKLDVSMKDLVDAALGDEDALRRITRAAEAANDAHAHFAEDGTWVVNNGLRDVAIAGDDLVRGLTGVSGSLEEAQTEARELAEATAEAEGKFVDVQHAVDAGYDPVLAGHIITQQNAKGGIDGTTGALDEQGEGFETAAEKIDAYLTKLQEFQDPIFALKKALDTQRTAQEDLDEVLADSEATAQDRKDAIWEMVEADAAVEAAALRASEKIGEFDGYLDRWIAKSDLTETEAAELRDMFGEVEGAADSAARDYEMRITLENFQEITSQLDGVERRAAAAAQNRSFTLSPYAPNPSQHRNHPKMHSGGWVTQGMRPPADVAAMMGLGSDEVPITAQVGELVIPTGQSPFGGGGTTTDNSSHVGRQILVQPGAFVQHVRDANDGMRAASTELDMMGRGYI